MRAALTYGGVSAFVVAFAIFPVAAALFRTADIPKRLIPGALSLGAFTFTMSALPGSPAIQNAIPMPFFGTTSFAAPGLGIVAAAVMFGLGILWLNRRAATARAAGEGYGAHEDNLPAPERGLRECAQGGGFDIRELEDHPEAAGQPSAVIALLPIVLVIVTNFAFTAFVIPAMDTGFLAEPRFGATSIEAVRGVWSVIVALFVAILVLIATNWGRLTDLRTSLDGGANASVLPIFNTASLVGFGAVIAALPVFAMISEAILDVTGGNPLLSVAASVTTLSAMTGSASGGMSIALEALGADPGGDGERLRRVAGGDAPGDRARVGDAGRAAAQRRGDHAACRLQAQPPASPTATSSWSAAPRRWWRCWWFWASPAWSAASREPR